MLKILLALMLVGVAIDVKASERSKLTRNRHIIELHHSYKTNPCNIQILQKKKFRQRSRYDKERLQASTCKECGVATAVIGSIFAYATFITWIAMNNPVKKF